MSSGTPYELWEGGNGPFPLGDDETTGVLESPFKRRCLANEPDYPWLEEIRSKIWNRKELEPELFRRVEITEAHYTELQKRLKERHPDRDSPEYDGGKHNVRRVKLDFLRSLTPLSPRHPDNNEDRVEAVDDPASNEGGFEINSFFPSILSFLDLSILDLKEKVPDLLPLPLFLRQEYDHISAQIEDDLTVVSGQPGTDRGKTTPGGDCGSVQGDPGCLSFFLCSKTMLLSLCKACRLGAGWRSLRDVSD